MSEILVYKTRLKPNKTQYEALSSHYGGARYAYNYFVSRAEQEYHLYEIGNSEYDETVPAADYRYYNHLWMKERNKKEVAKKWHKNNNSKVYREAAVSAANAYKNFFEGNADRPKYKSKHSRQSFAVEDRGTLSKDGYYITVGKVGRVRLCERLKALVWLIKCGSTIQQVTFSRDALGHDYVSIRVRVPDHVALQYFRGKKYKKGKGFSGVDVGISKYAALSDGQIVNNPRFFVKLEKKLAKAQAKAQKERDKLKAHRKAADKEVPGRSKEISDRKYRKAQYTVAKIHAQIRNNRTNFINHTARLILETGEVVCVESLSVTNMLKNHNLAKHISDASWGGLFTKLRELAPRYGVELVEADRWFASTQTCSKCGVRTKHQLSERTFICSVESCGHYCDRDLNAAINLRNYAIENIAARCAEMYKTANHGKTLHSVIGYPNTADYETRLLDLFHSLV